MHRRDFLNPARIAQTAGQVLGALDELHSVEVEQPADEYSLLRVSRRAMAADFEVLLPFGSRSGLEAGEAALDEIDRLEDQLTVYRDHSEVSRLNQAAAMAPVPVEDSLFELLVLARRIHEETDGAFDVTAGALIKAWGFFRRQQRLPSEDERLHALESVGMRHVVLDPATRSVRFLRRGLQINLGSIGKGYALDRAAEVLRRDWKISSALLHGGHSSVYAMGRPPADSRGWAVGIRHPWDVEKRIAVVRLGDRALGTSAATFQYLEWAGRKLGHILDPRSGWPAEAVASASVLAPTAAEADALATAFFILGVDWARAYCERRPDIAAVLLPQQENAAPVFLGTELVSPSPKR